MDWAQVTREFNKHFQGRILQGDSTRRPARTEGGLRSARPRIPEIVSLTGIAPRAKEKGKDEKKGGTSREAEKKGKGEKQGEKVKEDNGGKAKEKEQEEEDKENSEEKKGRRKRGPKK